MKYRILPILSDVIPATISACKGILFNTQECCPHCGGEVTDYDIRSKQFAVIMTDNIQSTVMVQVKRFQCRQCRRVVYADQPFYPGTRIGSPVVDLCVTFASMMPYARASAYLQRVGIVVDRWSVRNYVQMKIPVAMTEMYGTRLPESLVTLTALVAETRDDTPLDSYDVLSACGYPSSQYTGLHNPAPEKEKPVPDKTSIYQSLIVILGVILLESESIMHSLMSWGSSNLMDLAAFA